LIEAERPFDSSIRGGDDVRYYDLEQLIESADSELVVAETDGVIIGCGYARIENSNAYLKHSRHSYFGFMFVVPEHRGKGINRKIVDELESWSVSKGVTEVKLEVYAGNVGAIKAYEKAGFSGHLVEMRKTRA